MKSNEVADESYSINGFKHFSDLAVAYFPQMASTSSASKKMRNCIKASNALSEQLADAHYTDTTIEISPEMQLIIYRHWGPPHIILSVKVQRVAENKNTDKKSIYIFLNISFIFYRLLCIPLCVRHFFPQKDNSQTYSYLQ